MFSRLICNVVVVSFLCLFSAHGGSDWEKVECELLEGEYRDGDSFHVRVLGPSPQTEKEKIFRLYFVDTPETCLDFPKQVGDQMRDFGLDREADLVAAGQAAADFTYRLLRGQRFEVFTRWEDARGNSALPRYYGVVRVGVRNLGEELVRAGLARAYGKAYAPTGGALEPYPTSESLESFREGLRRLQSAALRRKIGAFSQTRLVLKPGEVVPQREYVDYEAELSEAILSSGLEEALRIPDMP
jgi:endonuclease YncB( thermonuclease family)